MILFPPVLIAQTQGPEAFATKCADLSKAKDWAGLEALARAQAAADPKDASAQAALGYALFAQKRSEEGRAACEAALALDPKRTDALFYLGLDHAQRGDAAGVEEIGRRVAAVSGDALRAYWAIPEIEDAVLGHRDLPIVQPSVLRFTSLSLDPVAEAIGPNGGPFVVAVTVDPEGRPTSARTLMAPEGASLSLEQAAMQWRVEPVMSGGKAVAGRFVKVVTGGTSFKIEPIRTMKVGA